MDREMMHGQPSPEPGRIPQPLEVTHSRNRMAGLWAAELLGLMGQAAQDYVRQVMHPGHEEDAIHGDDRDKVEHRLAGDLAGYANLAEIRSRMAHFLGEARRQWGGGKE